jgi:hypothetical protein
MNKKLRQFEKESKLEIFGLGAKRVPWEAALEKYAELIVRECSQISRDHQRNYYESHGDRIAKKIKEHFGVEE